jgi:two-component system, cell cycle sensor histidine kinase and response regulator CckA
MAIAIIALCGLSGAVAVASGRANRALSKTLNILCRALDASSEARLIVGADGRMVFANDAFVQLFPGGIEPPLDRVERALCSGGDARKQFRQLRDCAATGGVAVAVLLLNTGSNDRVSRFRIAVDPIDELPQYSYWSFQDLAAHEETELAIEDELNNLSELLDGVSIGFYSVDIDGHFRLVNHTFARWLDSTPSEMIAGGARLHDLVATPPLGETQPFQISACRGTRCDDVLLKTGRGHVVASRIAQNITVSRSKLRTRSVVCNLTPERAQEAALDSCERFRRCFAEAPVGIALIDRFGCFEEANRAAGDLLGTTPEHLKGQELIGMLEEEDRHRIAAKLSALAEGRLQPEPVEVRPKRRSDKTIVLYLGRLDDGSAVKSSSAPCSSARQPHELTAHFIDVSDQKNLEIQFAQSQKMQAVGQLAGGVAHDFNNLLTAMIGFCDLLLLRSPPGDPSFADIMQIKQNANRAANLVRQLLAFSRQQTLQPRVLDITDVLYELRHLVERLIGENIKLDVVHGRELWLTKVDQGQLEQVIINLAVNARDAMPNGGTLTIHTSNVRQDQELRRGHEMMPPGDYVLIGVADTGIGIAKENITRIFDPFFSTKELGSGTGLGLSTVYGIVKQTGGFIFVDSAPSEGAVFEIYLPRHRTADGTIVARVDSAEETAPKDLTGHGTIMLVEDDDPVRIFGARALRNKGYKVIEAKSGEAALELIRDAEERIDLMITDVVMPRMDGPRLVREVRDIVPQMKVIFISGYTEDAFRQRLDSDSGIDFLPKPFSLKQLATKVRDVIGVGAL